MAIVTSLFIAFLTSSAHFTSALALSSSLYLSANKTTTWTNNDKSFPQTIYFSDGSMARFILLHKAESVYQFDVGGFNVHLGVYRFGCCFYCSFSLCYFSIAFVEVADGSIADTPPQIVWSANRDQPVRENAVLTFFHDGDLVLTDADGSSIWSSNTTHQSVAGIRINKHGNLMLLNQTNGAVWQSFDHPTDTLLLGQILKKGQQLTSSISSKNLSSGFFYLCLQHASLSAYVSGDTPIQYLTIGSYEYYMSPSWLKYVEFKKGHLIFWFDEIGPTPKLGHTLLQTPSLISIQLLRLDADGGLRIYGWQPGFGWRVIHYFSNTWDECQFPLKCGKYGVCQNGQCTCPPEVDGIKFFVPVDSRLPNHGCRQIYHPTMQGSSGGYKLVNFGQLSYFGFFSEDAATPGLENEESCTQACVEKESSCKAAFFMYDKRSLIGYCYLASDVLSITNTPSSHDYYVSSHIKVQVPPSHGDASFPVSELLLIVMITCACLVLLVTISLFLRKRSKFCEDELCLDKFLSKTLLRFSYSELSVATDNFTKKLGVGGFGQVFRGALRDGTEIAVKRLENTGQGTKEFLAEVETVGYIHHINLVRLIGFCVENMHRIIVYEYLSNGSLDKWIFSENENVSLDWTTRKKVLYHIAKGLAYIHEECRQRIAHLDVKPHNILLDDNFNAKISDFGMSKLISRDESLVMTRIRGTLGYLAPEWQGSRITVKADIYSYGILVLEVVSGRMVLDYSKPESDVHLLKLLQKKSIENRIIEIVDSRCEDMRRHNGEECIEMIKLGLWCLHGDYRRRPAMSAVVKVLEGSLELETNFTYNFSSAFSPVCSHAITGLASFPLGMKAL